MAVSSEGAAFHSPYAVTPGSSTPSPEVGRKEGVSELWTFFWLAIVNTVIIGVAGVVTWLLVHH